MCSFTAFWLSAKFTHHRPSISWRNGLLRWEGQWRACSECLRVTLMSNTCSPQLNRNRQAYLEGGLVCMQAPRTDVCNLETAAGFYMISNSKSGQQRNPSCASVLLLPCTRAKISPGSEKLDGESRNYVIWHPNTITMSGRGGEKDKHKYFQ